MGEVIQYPQERATEQQYAIAAGAEFYQDTIPEYTKNTQNADVISIDRNLSNESYRQAIEDTATWLAETIDGPMRTSFDFYFDGYDIVSEDGRAMGPVFDKAIDDAKTMAKNNLGFSFELRRRIKEKEEYLIMQGMKDGSQPNTMIIVSDFPAELMSSNHDVGGYNVRRRQTMVRIISKKPNGIINITTQSLDKSDRKALEAIYHKFGVNPSDGELLDQRIQFDATHEHQELLPDAIQDIYDNELNTLYGGQWRAGTDTTELSNTYDFVKQNPDILEQLAKLKNDGQLSKKDLYNAAALIDQRLRSGKDYQSITGENSNYTDYQGHSISQQLESAGRQANEEGKTFSGCGSSISGEESDDPLVESLEILGFGNKTEKKDWKWKKGICAVKKCPTRPDKTLVGPCSVCKKCQKQFDAGRDPTR